MPVKKLVKKIKSAVARRRRPGVVSKTKGSTGVTNSTRRKYRTSNMTEKGVDRTSKPKASVTKVFKSFPAAVNSVSKSVLISANKVIY